MISEHAHWISVDCVAMQKCCHAAKLYAQAYTSSAESDEHIEHINCQTPQITYGLISLLYSKAF